MNQNWRRFDCLTVCGVEVSYSDLKESKCVHTVLTNGFSLRRRQLPVLSATILDEVSTFVKSSICHSNFAFNAQYTQ